MNQTPANILFLFPDQQRHDWLGDQPPVRLHTPYVQALAKRGVKFTHAITPSPVCAPARACLATGMRYERCGVMSNRDNLPPELPTVYQLLRDAGYAVLGCGKFDLAKAASNWGLDGSSGLKAWGFTGGCDSEGKWDGVSTGKLAPKGPYLDYLHCHGLATMYVADMADRRRKVAYHASPLPEVAYCDNWVGDQAERLLRGAAQDQPWFLQVNFPGPHDPWDITEAMERRARQIIDLPPPIRPADGISAMEHLAVRQNYSVMVENIDRRVGRLIDLIAQRGELDRTVIVYASDHGEMLGDHGRWGKSLPREASVRVPLVVAGAPDLPKGTVEQPVNLLDLSSSFCTWAGITPPSQWDSTPLSQRLAQQEPALAFSGLDDWRLVCDGRLKLTVYADGSRTLYDLKSDPDELTNLIDAQPEQAALLESELH